MLRYYIVAIADSDPNYDEYFTGAIREMPEVIPCPDCKYSHRDIDGALICEKATRLFDLVLHESDYCSKAVRKEGE